jgi:uncharacterized protein YbjT (DUF2867 family)
MSAINKESIVVLGATGAQGKSVVKSLLNDGKYHVIAVTRDANSDKAQELSKLSTDDSNLTIRSGDYTKPETLTEAFKGATGIFVVANYWEPTVYGKEDIIYSYIADAVKATPTIKKAIVNTLVNVAEVSKDTISVECFSGKARGLKHFQSLDNVEVVAYAPAFYYQNIDYFIKPIQNDDGVDQYFFPPVKQVTAFDVTDTGDIVTNVFNNWSNWVGKEIITVGELTTYADIIERVGKAKGTKVKYVEVPYEAYNKSYENAIVMGEMFRWFNEFGYYGQNVGHTDITKNNGSDVTGKPLTTFNEYLKKTYNN